METPVITKTLDVGEKGADDIESQERQDNAADVAEVDALARAGDHVHQTFKDGGGGVAQHLRTDNGEDGGGHGEDHHDEDADAVFAQIAQQLRKVPLKSLAFFTRHGPWDRRPWDRGGGERRRFAAYSLQFLL